MAVVTYFNMLFALTMLPLEGFVTVESKLTTAAVLWETFRATFQVHKEVSTQKIDIQWKYSLKYLIYCMFLNH